VNDQQVSVSRHFRRILVRITQGGQDNVAKKVAPASAAVHHATKNTRIGDIDVRTHRMECNLFGFDQPAVRR
jgi:hypothetical protein